MQQLYTIKVTICKAKKMMMCKYAMMCVCICWIQKYKFVKLKTLLDVCLKGFLFFNDQKGIYINWIEVDLIILIKKREIMSSQAHAGKHQRFSMILKNTEGFKSQFKIPYCQVKI